MLDLGSFQWNTSGFSLGVFQFIQEFGSNIATATAKYPQFILMKSRSNVEGYVEVLQHRRQYIDVLELGIMKGGSCVFFNLLLTPRRHMAIDIYEHESGLREFAAHARSQGRHFSARYDISQDNTADIISTYQETFGVDAQFDLVIDDASHNYVLSLASFNSLFPRLRVGGVYALEDWGWAHWDGPFQDEAHPEYSNHALSNLVLHSVLAVTGSGGIVAEVIVRPNTTFIIRGPVPVPNGFKIESVVPRRNRPMQYY